MVLYFWYNINNKQWGLTFQNYRKTQIASRATRSQFSSNIHLNRKELLAKLTLTFLWKEHPVTFIGITLDRMSCFLVKYVDLPKLLGLGLVAPGFSYMWNRLSHSETKNNDENVLLGNGFPKSVASNLVRCFRHSSSEPRTSYPNNNKTMSFKDFKF